LVLSFFLTVLSQRFSVDIDFSPRGQHSVVAGAILLKRSLWEREITRDYSKDKRDEPLHQRNAKDSASLCAFLEIVRSTIADVRRSRRARERQRRLQASRRFDI
jgi:hypothetical protein